MGIDDSASEVALRQLAMEDLSKAPPFARNFSDAAFSIMKALASGNVIEVVGLLKDIHSSGEAARSAYFFQCVVNDIRRIDKKVAELSAQQSQDFVELLLDADRKARQTRAKTRVKRMADILTASINMNPISSPDETEEMTGLAVTLSDQDVLVLKALRETQERYERDGGRTTPSLALASVPGLLPEVVLSICGKLLSQGLISDPQQRATSLGVSSYPRGGGFMLLERGQRFLKFLEQSPSATPA
jgi:hypothetical protein